MNRNQKKGVLAKGAFAEIRRFSSHCCSCTVCTATWHPMCPLVNSPYLSALFVCLSSICSKGCHVSWRQARYRTTSKLAEPKYSTAFDKNEKPRLCRSRVCLCRLPCESRRTSCCATSFRQFPQLSATFRHFPPLSATFRHFPPISANFRTLRWRSRRISGNFPHNFRTISANSRSAVCTAWALSHCTVEFVVHSGSAPGERCGCCSNVRPIEGFAQGQSQLLMQCHQDMQCMTTIKQLLGIVAMQCGWAV